MGPVLILEFWGGCPPKFSPWQQSEEVAVKCLDESCLCFPKRGILSPSLRTLGFPPMSHSFLPPLPRGLALKRHRRGQEVQRQMPESIFPSGFSLKFLLCGFYVLGTAMNTLVSRTRVVSRKADGLIIRGLF